MPYRFGYEGGIFRLYKIEGGMEVELCNFKKENIRNALEEYANQSGESSHWVGSILKLFHKAYLFSSNLTSDPPSPKNYPDSQLINYLKSKGYLIYENTFLHSITDKQIIDYLMSKGYTIEKDGIKEKADYFLKFEGENGTNKND